MSVRHSDSGDRVAACGDPGSASHESRVRPLVTVRDARPQDVAAIANLYYDTIRRVNARDYGPEQIAAWAPRIFPEAFWSERLARYQVFVAEAEQAIVGFAELGIGGHIDCFYAHCGWQRRGVGTRLMSRIEEAALRSGARSLTAEVSITARPFFAAMGFSVVRELAHPYRGQVFRVFLMERCLRATGRAT